MKIGILTLHCQVNYGGVLQAFALERTLKKAGVDVEIIDYWIFETRPLLLGTWLDKSRSLRSRIGRFIKHSIRYEVPVSEIRRRLRTIRFLNDHLTLSEKAYPTAEELNQVNGYDCIIAGSDQIWNHQWFGTPNPFLLGGISPSIRRIAYAPSFGFKTLPDERREEYKTALRRFDTLSVRERDGVEQIREWAGREAEWVLDPTLLLDEKEWDTLATGKQLNTRDYIFCYWLGDISEVIEPLKAISRREKLPIHLYVDAPMNVGKESAFWNRTKARLQLRSTGHVKLCRSAGPEEFVHGIKKSKYVLSNSFHAMMFAIIFEKPLRIFPATDKDRERGSSRMTSFANHYQLDHALCFGGIGEMKGFVHPDYKELASKLKQDRQRSLDYLTKALRPV